MKKIAIDIGYGDVKVAYKEDGKLKQFKFPTAIKKRKIASSTFGEDNSYSFEGKNYTIENEGDEIIPTRSYEFLEKFSPLIIYHILKKLNISPDEDIQINTGLSILNWQNVESFAKRISNIIVNEEVYKPTISLFAQGQGIYIDTLKTNNINSNNKIVVIDIGFNTTDVLVFNQATPIKEYSFAEEFGISKPVDELINFINNKYHFSLPEQVAKDIFVTNKMKIYGKEEDLSLVIEELKEDFTNLILEKLRNKIKYILRNSDYVIFSGGGAYYINKEQLPDNVIFSPKPYEFSNVRGYYEENI